MTGLPVDPPLWAYAMSIVSSHSAVLGGALATRQFGDIWNLQTAFPGTWNRVFWERWYTEADGFYDRTPSGSAIVSICKTLDKAISNTTWRLSLASIQQVSNIHVCIHKTVCNQGISVFNAIHDSSWCNTALSVHRWTFDRQHIVWRVSVHWRRSSFTKRGVSWHFKPNLVVVSTRRQIRSTHKIRWTTVGQLSLWVVHSRGRPELSRQPSISTLCSKNERWRNRQISWVWLLLTVFMLILTWLR